jgi:hypothetical protein
MPRTPGNIALAGWRRVTTSPEEMSLETRQLARPVRPGASGSTHRSETKKSATSAHQSLETPECNTWPYGIPKQNIGEVACLFPSSCFLCRTRLDGPQPMMHRSAAPFPKAFEMTHAGACQNFSDSVRYPRQGPSGAAVDAPGRISTRETAPTSQSPRRRCPF